MTSDLATGPSVAVDAGPSAAQHAPAELGAGMAHRARSQSVLAQHWSPSGLIGAVGRASVGFGLAVGRSRAIRPTVRYDDLNSAALRPSLELWRRRRDGLDDDPVSADSVDRVVVSADPRGESPPVRRSRDTVPGRRRWPRGAVARPSWTDQIIQRSSVGFVAPAPGGPMLQSAVPAGFVPSGDAKLDRLRLLVIEREGGADSEPREPRASAPPRDAASIPLRRSTAAEPTVAATLDKSVPGRLARSMRPEPAVAPAVPATPAGGGAVLPTAATRSTTPSQRASSPPAPRVSSKESERRAVRRSPRDAGPDKVERLRAALIERGLLAADAPDTGSGTDTARANASDTARASSRDTAPPNSPDVATPGADAAGSGDPAVRGPGSTSRAPQPQSPPGRAPALDVGEDRVTNTSTELRRSTDDRSTPRPAQQPSSALLDGGAERVTSTSAELRRSTDDRRTPRQSPSSQPSQPSQSSSIETTGAALRSTAPVAPDSRSPGPPGAIESMRQVRLQRLLRTGLSTADNVAVPDPDIVEGDVVGAGLSGLASSSVAASPAVGRLASTVATSSTIERDVPRIARSAPTARGQIRTQPVLLRAGADESVAVIRRVTLPRALSTGHRPSSTLRAAHEPADRIAPIERGASAAALITSPVVTPRPSVITLAEIAATPLVTGGTTHADDAGFDPTMPGSRNASPVARRSRSVVPPGTGALLDVVRRSPQPFRRQDASTVPADRVLQHDAPAIAPVARSRGVQSNDPVEHLDGPITAAPNADRKLSAEAPASTSPVDERVRVGQPGSDGDRAASPVRPAEQVADQFMTALSETVRRRPAPLPTTFRPMADAIAGPRPVMLSTDPASRRALRSVGKVAATTGDTIHLDEQAIPSARLAEVMAHELTHVAHPSPTPRFFDDIDDSPEERRAEQVAKVMARSPLAPAASVVAPAGRDGTRTIRRTPSSTARTSPPSPARSASPGGVTADQLAAQLTGSQSSPVADRNADVIRRTPSSTPVIQRGLMPGSDSDVSAVGQQSAVMSDEQFLAYFRDNLSQVMRLIEDRMIIELERRGGRTWGAL